MLLSSLLKTSRSASCGEASVVSATTEYIRVPPLAIQLRVRTQSDCKTTAASIKVLRGECGRIQFGCTTTRPLHNNINTTGSFVILLLFLLLHLLQQPTNLLDWQDCHTSVPFSLLSHA